MRVILNLGAYDAATRAWQPWAKEYILKALEAQNIDTVAFLGDDATCENIWREFERATAEGVYAVLCGCGHGDQKCTTAYKTCRLICTDMPETMRRMVGHSMLQVSCSVRQGPDSLINQLGRQGSPSTGVDVIYTFTFNACWRFVLAHAQQILTLIAGGTWGDIVGNAKAMYAKMAEEAERAGDKLAAYYLIYDGNALDLDSTTDRNARPYPREDRVDLRIRVVDKLNGEPVVGASVILTWDGKIRQCVTGGQGWCRIADAPRNTWADLHISHDAYRPLRNRFYCDKPACNLEFKLTPREKPPAEPPWFCEWLSMLIGWLKAIQNKYCGG